MPQSRTTTLLKPSLRCAKRWAKNAVKIDSSPPSPEMGTASLLRLPRLGPSLFKFSRHLLPSPCRPPRSF